MTALIIMGTVGGGGRTGSAWGVYASSLCQAETFDLSPVKPLQSADMLTLSADL